MLYYGERKKGCRFKEVYFHSLRTLIIENDLIRAEILVDKGVNIISYVHKSTDTDFIWTNPLGISCLSKAVLGNMDGDCQSDNYVGGVFEILPNVGDACNFGKVNFPNHGEVQYLPFEMRLLTDSAECVSIEFLAKLSKYPFMLKKVLTIRNDSTFLHFDETLTNLSGSEMPYLWAWHPCIGEPFLSDKCVFEFPNGEKVNMPTVGSGADIFKIFENGGNGTATVKNTQSGLSLRFNFDGKTFPFIGLWISGFNNTGHHRLGGAYVAAVLPLASEQFGIDKAAENKTALYIEPYGEKKTEFEFGCVVD